MRRACGTSVGDLRNDGDREGLGYMGLETVDLFRCVSILGGKNAGGVYRSSLP